MKQFFLVAVALSLAFCACAQKQNRKNFRVRNKTKEILGYYGVKAGVNMSTLTGDADNNSFLIGFNAGVFTLFKLSDNFGIMPEVVYSTQGTQVTSPQSSKLTLNYINVPILANIYASQILFFQLGPQVGILTNASLSNDTGTLDVTSASSGVDLSLAFGVGMDFEKLIVNARYNQGLNSTSTSGAGSYPNSVFQFSVAVPFEIKKTKKH